MASTAHCLMCFEALDAHLEKREALTLDQVHASWTSYCSSTDTSTTSKSSTTSSAPKLPALSRVADTSSSSSSSSTSLASSTPGTSTSSLSLNQALTSTPLFVTWNTLSRAGDPSLRGCIGTFEAQPLADGIPEYAVISAVHDSRFPAVTSAELPRLQAVVTLLTDFEDADDAYDWEIGTHGIRLSFFDRGRKYGATYLPDVAAEQEWTHDETLFSLVRKAGWMGSRSKWKDLDLKVTRYRGDKACVEYPLFKKWRDWAKNNQK